MKAICVSVATVLLISSAVGILTNISENMNATDIWNGETAKVFAGGTGHEESPYLISNGEQLSLLQELVNNGSSEYNGPDIYYMLTDDIHLNDIEDDGWSSSGGLNVWTAIGTSANPFDAVFDGNGYDVKGIYLNSSDDNRGLFGYVTGTVKDLGVDGHIEGGANVGGVAGYAASGATIENCHNSGTILGSGNYVGGIVGRNQGGTVIDCYNTGTVSGGSGIGGIVGYNNGGKVTNCYNTGTVSGAINGTGNGTGGVAGENTGVLTNCFNTGTVSGSNSVGGIVGINWNRGTIANTYNTGTVSGNDNNVGGIAGQNTSNSTISFSYFLNTQSKGVALGTENVSTHSFDSDGIISTIVIISDPQGTTDLLTALNDYVLNEAANGNGGLMFYEDTGVPFDEGIRYAFTEKAPTHIFTILVTDEEGETLEGATVRYKVNDDGDVTDVTGSDGKVTFTVSNADTVTVLNVSLEGYVDSGELAAQKADISSIIVIELVKTSVPVTHTVTIVVTDEDGIPVAGATAIYRVNVDEAITSFTGIDGKVTFAVFDGDTVTIIDVSSDGHVASGGRDPAIITADLEIGISLKAVEMTPEHTVTIIVTDEDGKAIAGATVDYTVNGTGTTAYTDHEGKVAFTVVDGDKVAVVSVEKDGYVAGSASERAIYNNATIKIELVKETPVPVTHDVTIIVNDEDGKLLAGATVVYRVNAGTEVTDATDAEGKVTFTVNDGDTVTIVSVALDGHIASAGSVVQNITDDRTVRITLIKNNTPVYTGTVILSGTVTDGTGSPLDGVTIEYTIDGVRGETSTDPSGHYEIEVPEGSTVYILSVTKDGYEVAGEYETAGSFPIWVPAEDNTVQDFSLSALGGDDGNGLFLLLLLLLLIILLVAMLLIAMKKKRDKEEEAARTQ